MKAGYMCEGCGAFHSNREFIWKCPACGKKVCESCFDRFMLCKVCAKGKTDEECKKLSGVDWDEDKEKEEEYL